MGLWSNLRTRNSKGAARNPAIMPGQDRGYAFRRSRTLTGTTSAKVAASAQQRGQLKTSRLKVHELHQERAKVIKLLLWLSFSMLFIVFLIVNYMGTLPIHYAQQKTGPGAPATDNYKQTMQMYFTQQPLQRFGFALNSKQLEEFMIKQHSELSGFEAQRSWYGGDVHFAAYLRKPLLVWQTGSKTFYVDGQGIAFTYDHFGESVVSVTDQSGIAPDAGSSVASQRFIKFLGKMVGAVNAGGKGQVSGVIIPASTREIDLHLQGREYPIKTHIDRDPLQQAEDIIKALGYFDTHNIKPPFIDVRVSGKAFYR